MAVAGRVAPLPKGAWNSSSEYEKLDIVSHGGVSYMAKKPSTNHEPTTDDEYWMVIVDGNPLLVDNGYISIDYSILGG